MTELHDVIWFATFRCPWQCAYCNTRSLPVIAHGAERTPEEWLGALEALGRPIRMMTVSGGEPGLYKGLSRVLEHPNVRQAHINTNLVRHPAQWLSAGVIGKAYSMSLSLHFDPDDARAESFWVHTQWLRDNCPETLLNVHVVRTQQVSDDQAQRAYARCVAIGVGFCTQDYCYAWAYRDAAPRLDGSCLCTAGVATIAVLPDGTLCRCLGQTYGGTAQSLGNAIDDGWGALQAAAYPCANMTCANALLCEGVEREQTSGTGEIIHQGGLW